MWPGFRMHAVQRKGDIVEMAEFGYTLSQTLSMPALSSIMDATHLCESGPREVATLLSQLVLPVDSFRFHRNSTKFSTWHLW